jgi:hypothetical protein
MYAQTISDTKVMVVVKPTASPTNLGCRTDWMMKFRTLYTAMTAIIRPGPPISSPSRADEPDDKTDVGDVVRHEREQRPQTGGGNAQDEQRDAVENRDDAAEDGGDPEVFSGAFGERTERAQYRFVSRAVAGHPFVEHRAVDREKIANTSTNNVDVNAPDTLDST